MSEIKRNLGTRSLNHFGTGAILVLFGFASAASANDLTYPIVDTKQVHAYDDRVAIEFPQAGEQYYGQDAQYATNQPSYKDNGDGTVSDLVTGLMWVQDPGEKVIYKEAVKGASACKVGGYSDWRLPSIKELFSLIQFNGTDPDVNSSDASSLTPFIEASVFKFEYGKEENGDRIIDSQFATTAVNVSPVMNGMEGMFGVNFADGRIKCYPMESPRGSKKFFVHYVRGNPEYGINKFRDNGDGTVTDLATGLMWMKADSVKGLDWPSALEYAENMELAGHSDWRLPDAKELQSIVDYSRSPDATDSAAIDPVFHATSFKNVGGVKDFGWYWSSTSHLRGGGGDTAVYVTFGRSLGWMPDRRSRDGDKLLQDVHGAGSQRSDPKVGDASRYPYGRGPQGDVIRIENLVRCVRGGDVEVIEKGPKIDKSVQSARRRPMGERMEGNQNTPTGGQNRQVSQNSPRGQRSQGGQRPQGGQASQGIPTPEEFIARFDKNEDGKVSKSEFPGPEERFTRMDSNGDGVINPNEVLQGPPPERRN